MYKEVDEIAGMEDGRSKVIAAARTIRDIADDLGYDLSIGTLPDGAIDAIYDLALMILEQEDHDEND